VDVEGDPERTPIEPVQVSLEAALQDTVIYGTEVVPWGVDAVQARGIWDLDDDGIMDDGVPTGAGIKVCVIDTGYYAEHEDLKAGVTGMSQVDDAWATDGYGHGSHVAGTIGALNNGLGVVGVSPGMVDYHIVKIFDNTGAWVTRASDLTAAIYDCRDNGANVISMSLGGTSSNRREERAFDELYAAGILHVAAAGNEQVDYPGTISYPASYSSVISVAAIDEAMLVADFSNQNEFVELAAPGVNVLSTIPYIETNTVTVDGDVYTANHIEFSPYGTASGVLVYGGRCTASGSWDGMVVLCERGDISFFDKVMAVQNGGGAAAVIYNNEPGNFFGTLGEGFTSSIVGLSLSQENGQYLVAEKLGLNANLTSEFVWPANGYEAWGGTSMATPHVAGVAALIWSANPSWTNVQIREAMNETAVDLGLTGKDEIYGNGLVQAADALDYLLVGSPPQAYDQSVSTDVNSPVNITLSGTGDDISFTLVSSPSNGTLIWTPPVVTYTPDDLFVGVDSFQFKVIDTNGVSSNIATVTIEVTEVNHPPTDINLSQNTILENSSINQLIGEFSTVDPDENDVFNYSMAVGQGDDDNGSFNIINDQLYALESFNFENKDQYSIRVRSSDAEQAELWTERTFTIFIIDDNDAPVANEQQVETGKDISIEIVLSGFDEDGDLLTYNYSNPISGTLTGVAPNLVYSPEPGFSGMDSFSFTVSDGEYESDPALVMIVIGVSDYFIPIFVFN
jgi:subtilisin family serine protease